MRRLSVFAVAVLSAMAMFAQTPKEIVAQMEAVMAQHQDEGVIMTMEMKLPGMDAVSAKVYMLGKKSHTVMEGNKSYMWSDETTSWNYDPGQNQLTISPVSGSQGVQTNGAMFSDISEDYKIKLTNESEYAWFFKCKRIKKKKGESKKMDLVVAKDTYYPVSLSTKALLISIAFKNISFGVTEEQVTFNQADYPTATIIDKR